MSSTNDSGSGSLRQAILDAQSSSSSDTITFAISGSGLHTIALASELPAISEGVRIDGWSQPGFAGTPLIELHGNTAIAQGLKIAGPDVEVRGLAIDGFSSGAGIAIVGPSAAHNWIYGNVLGGDASGRFALRNANGVVIRTGAHDNIIGTDGDGQNDSREANLITANAGAGVLVASGSTDDSRGFAFGDTSNPLVVNGSARIQDNRLRLTNNDHQAGTAPHRPAGRSGAILRPVPVPAHERAY